MQRHPVADTQGFEGAERASFRVTGGAVNLLSFFEKKAGEVRPILTGDSEYERAPGHDSPPSGISIPADCIQRDQTCFDQRRDVFPMLSSGSQRSAGTLNPVFFL